MAIALNALVSKMVRQALWRRGFSEPALVTQWASIAGAALAARTAPLRIVFPRRERTGGTLHVKVDGPFAVELQHVAPLVVERVNAYYGFAALDRLALHQAPVQARAERREDSAPADGARPNRPAPQAAVVEIGNRGTGTAVRRRGQGSRAETAERPRR